MSASQTRHKPTLSVERADAFRGAQLHELCEAAEEAIVDGGGFGWLSPPPRATMEAYWKGVLLVPERELFLGSLDGTVAGSAQLLHPSPNQEAQRHCGTLTTFFVAPWARGHGLALRLVQAVEAAARRAGLQVLNLDVRDTQARAIEIYDQLGFTCWGVHPRYVSVDGQWFTGRYYYKDLEPGEAEAGPAPSEG